MRLDHRWRRGVLEPNPVHPNRLRDVLDRLLAQVVEVELELAPDLVEDSYNFV